MHARRQLYSLYMLRNPKAIGDLKNIFIAISARLVAGSEALDAAAPFAFLSDWIKIASDLIERTDLVCVYKCDVGVCHCGCILRGAAAVRWIAESHKYVAREQMGGELSSKAFFVSEAGGQRLSRH